LAYFDFNFVTNPPNDELVDEVTQLNENWEEVDRKISAFNSQPADFTGITVPIGTEAFDPEHPGESYRVAVWNGTTWIRSLNHISAWASWQNIGLRAPVIARATGYEVKARVDVVARRIVLMGGVQLNATADPWSTSTTYEITSDTAIQHSFGPVSGVSYQQAATGQITTAGGFASAAVRIEKVAGPPARTAIYVRYQGDAGGGNFIMLDGIEWWY
jgi:hypothetical protein